VAAAAVAAATKDASADEWVEEMMGIFSPLVGVPAEPIFISHTNKKSPDSSPH
jgi:uncharacterized short protein YbdD (DUF466 family)